MHQNRIKYIVPPLYNFRNEKFADFSTISVLPRECITSKMIQLTVVPLTSLDRY